MARAFGAEGYDLLLVVRQESDALKLADELTAEILVADLADELAPVKIFEFLMSRFGRLEVLINNATVHGPIGLLGSLNQRAWDQALRVDLLAPASLCRLAV